MKTSVLILTMAVLVCTCCVVHAVPSDPNNFINYNQLLTTGPGIGPVTTILSPDGLNAGAFTSTLPGGASVYSALTTTLPANFPITSTLAAHTFLDFVVTTTLPNGPLTTTLTFTTALAITPLPPDWQDQLIGGLELTTWLYSPAGYIPAWTTVTRPNLDNVIPEPASMLLLGSSLVGLAGYSLKKKIFK